MSVLWDVISIMVYVVAVTLAALVGMALGLGLAELVRRWHWWH